MPPEIVLEQTNPNSITAEAYFAHRWTGPLPRMLGLLASLPAEVLEQ